MCAGQAVQNEESPTGQPLPGDVLPGLEASPGTEPDKDGISVSEGVQLLSQDLALAKPVARVLQEFRPQHAQEQEILHLQASRRLSGKRHLHITKSQEGQRAGKLCGVGIYRLTLFDRRPQV